jgi:hypothetical protein
MNTCCLNEYLLMTKNMQYQISNFFRTQKPHLQAATTHILLYEYMYLKISRAFLLFLKSISRVSDLDLLCIQTNHMKICKHLLYNKYLGILAIHFGAFVYMNF